VERIERDADGERDLKHAEGRLPHGGEEVVEVLLGEDPVLEYAQ
jgi:hypothetical protein